MIRTFVALATLSLLAACGGADTFAPAPMIEVQRRAYVHEGPAEITLYTVIETETGEGQHTALLINGTQRVLWDPAGSFRHPQVPERGDLHYGITETIRKVYEGRPDVVDMLKDGKISLVMNTTEGAQAVQDSREIRSVALYDKIPYYTTAAAAHAAAQAMQARQEGEIKVMPLQGSAA